MPKKKPTGSLPCSQQPVTSPYHQPYEFSPCHKYHSLKAPFNIIRSPQLARFPLPFRTKIQRVILTHSLLSLPCVLCALPI
jgi:hypothetical protein